MPPKRATKKGSGVSEAEEVVSVVSERRDTTEFEKLCKENDKLRKELVLKENRIGTLEANLQNYKISNDRILAHRRTMTEQYEKAVLEKDVDLHVLQAKYAQLQKKYESLEKENEEVKRASNDGQGRFLAVDDEFTRITLSRNEELLTENSRLKQDLLCSTEYRRAYATEPDDQAAMIEALQVRLTNCKVSLMEERKLVDAHVMRERKLFPGFMYTLLEEYEGKHLLLPATVGLPYNKTVKNGQWLCDVCKKKTSWYCWNCWHHGGYQPQPPYLCAFDHTDCWDHHICGNSFRKKEGMYKDTKKPMFLRNKLIRTTEDERRSPFAIDMGYDDNAGLTRRIRTAGSAMYNKKKLSFVAGEALDTMLVEENGEIAGAHPVIKAATSSASNSAGLGLKDLIPAAKGLNPSGPEAVDLILGGEALDASQAVTQNDFILTALGFESKSHLIVERMAREIVKYSDPSMFKEKQNKGGAEVGDGADNESSGYSDSDKDDVEDVSRGVSSNTVYNPKTGKLVGAGEVAGIATAPIGGKRGRANGRVATEASPVKRQSTRAKKANASTGTARPLSQDSEGPDDSVAHPLKSKQLRGKGKGSKNQLQILIFK